MAGCSWLGSSEQKKKYSLTIASTDMGGITTALQHALSLGIYSVSDTYCALYIGRWNLSLQQPASMKQHIGACLLGNKLCVCVCGPSLFLGVNT